MGILQIFVSHLTKNGLSWLPIILSLSYCLFCTFWLLLSLGGHFNASFIKFLPHVIGILGLIKQSFSIFWTMLWEESITAFQHEDYYFANLQTIISLFLIVVLGKWLVKGKPVVLDVFSQPLFQDFR